MVPRQPLPHGLAGCSGARTVVLAAAVAIMVCMCALIWESILIRYVSERMAFALRLKLDADVEMARLVSQ